MGFRQGWKVSVILRAAVAAIPFVTVPQLLHQCQQNVPPNDGKIIFDLYPAALPFPRALPGPTSVDEVGKGIAQLQQLTVLNINLSQCYGSVLGYCRARRGFQA